MSNYLNDRPDDDRKVVTEMCPNCEHTHYVELQAGCEWMIISSGSRF